jgi:recombination protein RecR
MTLSSIAKTLSIPSKRASDPIAELVELLARLPGVGERTATRLCFFVLRQQPEYAHALSKTLANLHHRVRKCQRCGNYGSEQLCTICMDHRRDSSTVCIVATVQDLVAVERTNTFRGVYFVLHQLLAPLDGVHPEHLNIGPLLEQMHTGGIKEVIVATPLSVEGEATALYLAGLFRPLGIMVSRIASGVPHGGELEFTDHVTMERAFEGRKAL